LNNCNWSGHIRFFINDSNDLFCVNFAWVLREAIFDSAGTDKWHSELEWLLLLYELKVNSKLKE